MRAEREKTLGSCTTQPARRAGNHHHTPGEVLRHLSALHSDQLMSI
jgi:hypothetical protein